MDREKILAKELNLKAKLRSAIRDNDNTSKERIREELTNVRRAIGSVTVEEAYGRMSY